MNGALEPWADKKKKRRSKQYGLMGLGELDGT
jgi:hypothetical protein